MDFTVQLKGADELDRRLTELDGKVATQLGKDALRAGAVPMQAAIRDVAPHRTGELIRKIVIVAGKSRKGLVSVVVRARAKYSGWVDLGHFLGHRLRGKFKGANAKTDYHKASVAAGRQFVPGQHFMEQGAARAQGASTEIIINTLKAGIDEANHQA